MIKYCPSTKTRQQEQAQEAWLSSSTGCLPAAYSELKKRRHRWSSFQIPPTNNVKSWWNLESTHAGETFWGVGPFSTMVSIIHILYQSILTYLQLFNALSRVEQSLVEQHIYLFSLPKARWYCRLETPEKNAYIFTKPFIEWVHVLKRISEMESRTNGPTWVYVS